MRKELFRMYTESTLVGIAKRENNKKRSYLVVNRLQGKHVPVSPSAALAMFDELAQILCTEYAGESLLFIGFAETATAIGARLAIRLDSYYMQTTREYVPGADYLYFTESHSHATEQKLVKNDLDAVIDRVRSIVFVEDEVTTGNTILNIVDIIEKRYPGRISFSVASILNGMDDAAIGVYHARNIKVHYLVKTNHGSYTRIAEGVREDGEYIGKNEKEVYRVPVVNVSGWLNARRCVTGKEYEIACGALWKQIESRIFIEKGSGVLVLGTEEFMYPALYAAKRIEDCGAVVKFHATTRSPIAVSTGQDYPLHSRYELSSLYDADRTTFIYDLDSYDQVIIITDADHKEKDGICSLVNALSAKGNRNIIMFRWC